MMQGASDGEPLTVGGQFSSTVTHTSLAIDLPVPSEAVIVSKYNPTSLFVGAKSTSTKTGLMLNLCVIEFTYHDPVML